MIENKYNVPKRIWAKYTDNQRATYLRVRDFVMLSRGNFPVLKNTPRDEWELIAKVLAEGVTDTIK